MDTKDTKYEYLCYLTLYKKITESNNDTSLIKPILSFIRCINCKYLEYECICSRCPGICNRKVFFEKCHCKQYCHICNKKTKVYATKYCTKINCQRYIKTCDNCHTILQNKKQLNNGNFIYCNICNDIHCNTTSCKCDEYYTNYNGKTFTDAYIENNNRSF